MTVVSIVSWLGYIRKSVKMRKKFSYPEGVLWFIIINYTWRIIELRFRTVYFLLLLRPYRSCFVACSAIDCNKANIMVLGYTWRVHKEYFDSPKCAVLFFENENENENDLCFLTCNQIGGTQNDFNNILHYCHFQLQKIGDFVRTTLQGKIQ